MPAATPRFHKLRVAEVRRDTPDAVSVAFDVPPDLREQYGFAPGQYLTLRTTIDGEELRRSYSICTCPEDGELRIGVKRIEGGVLSNWMNSAVKAGDIVDLMTPTGRFGAPPASGEARVFAAFAAGSGITPVLSVMRGVLAHEPESRFFLFFGNRSTGDIMFLETLEELKDRYMGRLSVFYVLSQEQQDLPILNGRLDAEKVRILLRHIVPLAILDHVFICGPAGMSEDIEAALKELGVAPDRIHVERFVSVLSGRPQPQKPAPSANAAYRTATLIVDGRRTDVPVTEEESVLDAALRAGLDLPYACKGGMCSTCRARVLEGAVTMEVNYSLEPRELEAGFVLTCQSHPRTQRVVIDYDQA
jgi:ring-1,2-phenylacetyl-CoA epoxidase subunit PaaE